MLSLRFCCHDSDIRSRANKLAKQIKKHLCPYDQWKVETWSQDVFLYPATKFDVDTLIAPVWLYDKEIWALPFSFFRAPELMKTNSVIRIGNDPSTTTLPLSDHSSLSFFPVVGKCWQLWPGQACQLIMIYRYTLRLRSSHDRSSSYVMLGDCLNFYILYPNCIDGFSLTSLLLRSYQPLTFIWKKEDTSSVRLFHAFISVPCMKCYVGNQLGNFISVTFWN